MLFGPCARGCICATELDGVEVGQSRRAYRRYGRFCARGENQAQPSQLITLQEPGRREIGPDAHAGG